MRRSASIALALAACHLVVALAPCPGANAAGAAREAIAGAGTKLEHAHHAEPATGSDDAMPCHEQPSDELRSPCRCGCGGALPGQEPVRSALAKALLTPAGGSLEESVAALASAATPCPTASLPDRIEHVPIAA